MEVAQVWKSTPWAQEMWFLCDQYDHILVVQGNKLMTHEDTIMDPNSTKQLESMKFEMDSI